MASGHKLNKLAFLAVPYFNETICTVDEVWRVTENINMSDLNVPINV